MIISLLILSMLLQMLAAVLAFRLIPLTRRRAAWSLIAGAVLLMAFRRGISIVRLLSGDADYQPDVLDVALSAVISLILAVGIASIASIFKDRLAAEKALEESETLYRKLFEDHSAVKLMIDPDTGRIVDGNQAAQDYYGWTREELRKMNVWDVNILPPEEVRREMENVRTSQRTYFEFRHRRADGSIREVEVFSSRIAVHGKDLLHSIVHDVSARKQIEEALKERDVRFRKLSDHVPGMIYQFLRRPDGTYCVPFTSESIRDIFGCAPEDVRADIDAIRRAILPEDIAPVIASIEDSAREMTLWQCEYRVQPLSGGPVRWMFGQSTPEKLPDGGIIWHGFITDITARKEAGESLERTLASLRRAVGATIQAMTAAVEVKDPYTAGHQRRVADLARSIATEMGLSQETIDGIRMAGVVHDIGKIAVPTEILAKPTPLTPLEYSLIKEHSGLGYTLLKNVESPWPLAEIVYQHHERMDGSGYPRGLAGEAILPEARIMAVADVVEAMASYRPYRPALGLEKALAEIENHRGTLYDADAVDACLKLFRDKSYRFPE
ncbi:MAG: PAS domain S-box protein [Deltaproteobacteria bacterium]|nr:PAS domain S-box protein [Syntrophaceae bacterium]NLX53075.1 PAS domain S-box protein [Deltaproteobacteria bacterium]